MHETAVRMIAALPRCLAAAVGVLLLSSSLVIGQQPLGGGSGGKPATKPPEKPAAKSLEDLLAAALKNNPDIRVAEAKVREAEAELNRARLQTTQKLVTLYRGLEAQKALVQSAEAEAERFMRLQQTGAAPTGSMETSRQKALQAKAKLNELEAELAYLTGQQPGGSAAERLAHELERVLYAQNLAQAQVALAEEAVRRAAAAKVQGSMADRLRKALDGEVTVDFRNTDLYSIVKTLEDRTGGIPIVINMEGRPRGIVDLSFPKPVPLGAALQALEDAASIRFTVRQYGLFVTETPRLPPGAVLLQDFWKGRSEKEKPKPPATESKK